MNDAMSLGIHRLWKDHFVRSLNPRDGWRCLDVAGGTGDIALRILDHARERHADRELRVEILDINPAMLAEGRKRVARTMYHATPQVAFTEGNAEHLDDVPDASIDLYTIAFGIRNCTHVDRVLREAHRVLRPGGIFACLEFGKVSNPLLARAYSTYSFRVIPHLGHIIAGDRDSYQVRRGRTRTFAPDRAQYLVESIERFPSQERFAKMIADVGFALPRRAERAWEDLTFGVAAIHRGVKV